MGLGGLARAAVGVVARAADVVKPAPPGLVVLAYHQVGAPQAGSVNLTVDAFDAQMAHLAAGAPSGRLVDIDTAIDSLDGSTSAPLVTVTFDDGTADFVEHALPVLVRHRIPVTLYLATAFVEEGRSFWDDGTVLSWSALREACSTGLVTIGSHTHSHVLLDRVDAATAAYELDRSRDLIGERLDVEAQHFAYPKALAPSPDADALVRERFRSAALAGGRPNSFGRSDPYRLARTPIVVRDGQSGFVRKASGGLRLEGVVRERWDARRYAGRTS